MHLFTLLRRAAWAPAAVLAFHQIVLRTPYRANLDFLVHFLGGAAIAYFLFHALDCFSEFLGSVKMHGRILFSFALACTVGLFWEFGELFSDVALGTHIQSSVRGVFSDLIADTLGALLSLFCCWFFQPNQSKSLGSRGTRSMRVDG